MAPQNFTAVLPGGTRMTFDATLPDGRPPIGQMSECEVVCRAASALRDQGWRLTSLSLHPTGARSAKVDVEALVKQSGLGDVPRRANRPDLVAVHQRRRITPALEGKGVG